MKYIYLILMLIASYVSYKGICISKTAPFKIRLMSSVVTIGMFIRSLSLFIMFFSQNLAYLYLLKPLLYLNLICIPIIVFIILMILCRNNKINFSYLFVIFFILIVVYIIFMFKFDASIIMDKNFGYISRIISDKFLQDIILVFYTLCLFSYAVLLKKKSDNKNLIVFSLLICMVCILEVFLNKLNKTFIPNLLISNCLWLTMLNYILYKIKKSR